MSGSDEAPDPQPGSARKDHVYGKPPGAGDWRRIGIGGLGVISVMRCSSPDRETVEINLVVTTASIR